MFSSILVLSTATLLSLASKIKGCAGLEPWQTLPATPSLDGLLKTQGYATVDDGTKIWYGRSGLTTSNKSPLLFLHGGFANSNYFGNQIKAFADQYSIISIDTRGHGRSYDGSVALTYDRFSQDVLQVLDQLSVPKVSIVGWSDGAIIGFDIAMNHSERLDRLFAYGGSYSPDNANATAGDSPVAQEFFERVAEEYLALSPTPDHLDVFSEKVNTMFATLPQWNQASFSKIPGGTGSKIAVSDGAEEEVLKRDTASTIKSWISGSKLVILPKVSHFGFLQDPTSFNAAVKAFLS